MAGLLQWVPRRCGSHRPSPVAHVRSPELLRGCLTAENRCSGTVLSLRNHAPTSAPVFTAGKPAVYNATSYIKRVLAITITTAGVARSLAWAKSLAAPLGIAPRCLHLAIPVICSGRRSMHLSRKANVLLGSMLGLLGMVSMAQAQAAAGGADSVIRPDLFKVVTLHWNGLTWNIPQRFFQGIRHDPEELWIQFFWRNDDVFLANSSGSEGDIFLDVHIFQKDIEDPDPYNGSYSLPLSPISWLTEVDFRGLKYLGSFSGAHYFKMKDYEDTYVLCRTDTMVKWPENSSILTGTFYCDVVFKFPHHNFAWVSTQAIKLSNVNMVFSSARRELASFIGMQGDRR